jgi:hypothetical protein
MAQQLHELPEDIVILVLTELDAPQHLRVLSLTSRALHGIVKRLGWRIFVRTQFPSLTLPPVKTEEGWMRLANSLTWQSASCWDRRGLQFSALLPQQHTFGRQNNPNYGRPTVGRLFHPVLDVRADLDLGKEFLVWGEGENIQARLRQKGLRQDVVDESLKTFVDGEATWTRSEGKSNGFQPGYDDIRAIKIVDHLGALQGDTGLLVGRYNGDLRLVSAEPGNFGQTISKFRPSRQKTGPIYSVDVLRQGRDTRIAVASKSSVLIYDLAAGPPHKIDPLTTWELPPSEEPPPARGDWRAHRQSPDVHQAIWMAGGKHIALGLHASTDPLRYLTITPSGWVCQMAAKNIDVEAEFGLEYKNICPRSLQPVTLSPTSLRESTLLLSSWKDGTCR